MNELLDISNAEKSQRRFQSGEEGWQGRHTRQRAQIREHRSQDLFDETGEEDEQGALNRSAGSASLGGRSGGRRGGQRAEEDWREAAAAAAGTGKALNASWTSLRAGAPLDQSIGGLSSMSAISGPSAASFFFSQRS